MKEIVQRTNKKFEKKRLSNPYQTCQKREKTQTKKLGNMQESLSGTLKTYIPSQTEKYRKMDKFGDKLPTKIQTRSYRELKQYHNNNYESISLMNIDPSSFNKILAS